MLFPETNIEVHNKNAQGIRISGQYIHSGHMIDNMIGDHIKLLSQIVDK